MPSTNKKEKKIRVKSKKSKAATVTQDDIKLGQELSAVILKEINSKNNLLTKSYSKNGSLPMGFVWPVDPQPDRMIPKGSSKFYPPSEYKENFVPFPIQEKVKSYSDVLNESPITLSFAKNTQDWQTQYKKSFQPFEPESIHELGPVAGSAPVEDVGRLAPTFFAWELNAPLPAESPVVVESNKNSSDVNLTEHQEMYHRFPLDTEGKIAVNSNHEYKPDFLGNEISGCSEWKSESQAIQEATEIAKSEALLSKDTPPYVAGNKMMVPESHPGYFAWSRTEPAADYIPKGYSNDVIISSEMRAASAESGDLFKSEYASNFNPLSVEMPVKTAKAEQQLQMGQSPEDMDASKWASEYHDNYIDKIKNTAPEQLPESQDELKKRKPVKKSSVSSSLNLKDVDNEVDGFVVIEKPEEEISSNKSILSQQRKDKQVMNRQKSIASRKTREEGNKIFDLSSASLQNSNDNSQFVSVYEQSFAWPGPPPPPLANNSAVSGSNSPLLGTALVSPPYALDSDPVQNVVFTKKTYGTTPRSEPPLNLFESAVNLPNEKSQIELKPPYACGDLVFAGSKEINLGKAESKLRPRTSTPGIPSSEYNEKFSWAESAVKEYKERNVKANRRSMSVMETARGLSYTLGGGADAASNSEASSSRINPPPKVINNIPEPSDSIKALALETAASSKVFTVKETKQPERAWVSGDKPPSVGYIGKNSFFDKKPTKTKATSEMKTVDTFKSTMSVDSLSLAKSANKGKLQFSGKISSSNTLPLNLTTRPSTALTRKVDDIIQSASESAKIRRAITAAERKEASKHAGFTFSRSDGNLSGVAATRPSTAVLKPSNNNTSSHLYDSNNSIVASSLSGFSPTKAFPIRPSDHVFSPMRVKLRQNESRMASNPILKNARYPNYSDAQTGRWVSETHRSFITAK